MEEKDYIFYVATQRALNWLRDINDIICSTELRNTIEHIEQHRLAKDCYYIYINNFSTSLLRSHDVNIICYDPWPGTAYDDIDRVSEN